MLKAVVVRQVWRLHMTAHKAGVKCRLFYQASLWYAFKRNILMQELQQFVVVFIVNHSTTHAMIWQYILTRDTYTWWHIFHCWITRFKSTEGHRKMFCGSSQWEVWVTKPQLSVLMPSQQASVSGGSHCPAAGRDISFLCQMACWASLSSCLTGWWDCQFGYLPLAKRIKLAVILLSTHCARWKWYYSWRFTAVQGKTLSVSEKLKFYRIETDSERKNHRGVKFLKINRKSCTPLTDNQLRLLSFSEETVKYWISFVLALWSWLIPPRTVHMF